jgi:predicted nucleotidyltransferase
MENEKIEKVVKIIKDEIEARGLKVVKIILFGSRAKGTPKEDSDWDFLVIIDKDSDRNTKLDIIVKIKRELALLKIPNDVIINSIKGRENHCVERKTMNEQRAKE